MKAAWRLGSIRSSGSRHVAARCTLNCAAGAVPARGVLGCILTSINGIDITIQNIMAAIAVDRNLGRRQHMVRLLSSLETQRSLRPRMPHQDLHRL